MLLGILGDIHTRATRPRNRVDQFVKTFWKKLHFAFDTFVKNNVELVLIPGDLFHDYGNDPCSILYDMLVFLKSYQNINVLCVGGQHDMRFHNIHLTDTPLQILRIAGALDILDKPINLNYDEDQTIRIAGASFNQEIPTLRNAESFNILVIHDMVVKDKKLWEGQNHYSKAKKLLMDTEYNLIVSGDNHQGFTETYEGKMLINCGSLTRMNIDQVDHQPRFYIFDTITCRAERFNIPIMPSEAVFSIDEKVELENRTEELQKFTDTLKVRFKKQFSFRSNLQKLIKENPVSKRVQTLIEHSFQPGGKNDGTDTDTGR